MVIRYGLPSLPQLALQRHYARAGHVARLPLERCKAWTGQDSPVGVTLVGDPSPAGKILSVLGSATTGETRLRNDANGSTTPTSSSPILLMLILSGRGRQMPAPARALAAEDENARGEPLLSAELAPS